MPAIRRMKNSQSFLFSPLYVLEDLRLSHSRRRSALVHIELPPAHCITPRRLQRISSSRLVKSLSLVRRTSCMSSGRFFHTAVSAYLRICVSAYLLYLLYSLYNTYEQYIRIAEPLLNHLSSRYWRTRLSNPAPETTMSKEKVRLSK